MSTATPTQQKLSHHAVSQDENSDDSSPMSCGNRQHDEDSASSPLIDSMDMHHFDSFEPQKEDTPAFSSRNSHSGPSSTAAPQMVSRHLSLENRPNKMEQAFSKNIRGLKDRASNAKSRISTLTKSLVSAKLDGTKMKNEHRKLERKRKATTLPPPTKFLDPYSHSNRRSVNRTMSLDQVLEIVVKPLMEMQQKEKQFSKSLSKLQKKSTFICRPLPGIVFPSLASSPPRHVVGMDSPTQSYSPSSPVYDSPTPPSPLSTSSCLLSSTTPFMNTPTRTKNSTDSMDITTEDDSSSTMTSSPSTSALPEYLTFTRSRASSVSNVRDNTVKRFLYEALSERESHNASEREKQMEERIQKELQRVLHQSSKDMDLREKEVERVLQKKRREELGRRRLIRG